MLYLKLNIGQFRWDIRRKSVTTLVGEIRYVARNSVEQQSGTTDLSWKSIDGLEVPFGHRIIDEESEKKRPKEENKGAGKRSVSGGGPKRESNELEMGAPS